ncbi:MAG TPA: flagellar hook-length control protein FliK [Angustibacter sp.]|nr:flagellar hook-length control protein FliK [Angustibacter sp.]
MTQTPNPSTSAASQPAPPQPPVPGTPTSTVSAPAPQPVPTAATQLLTAQLGPRALAAAVAATTSGLHTINVQLRPAQLGTVQVVATMGDHGLTVHLHAASDATREVLRSALADLQADLTAGGIGDLASLDVSDHAPDQQQSWNEAGESSPGGGSRADARAPLTAAAEPLAVPRLLPTAHDRRVDLRV